MNKSQIGHYLFLAGVIIAVIAGLINLGIPHLGTILVLLGAIVGFVNVSGAESRTFLIAGIAFLATASALNGLPGLGDSIAGIAANLSAFASPAVLIVAIKSLLTTAGD
ncbi:MAG: hypothetical protein HKN50_11470 [Gammaproteobacteria bacterium]|nr:hypothetical protein [Gammaproteobacteria bacterium]